MLAERKIAEIQSFEKKIWLFSPAMHGPEQEYITEAYRTNWMSTVGENINEAERLACEKVGCEYAMALSAGMAVLSLYKRCIAERLSDGGNEMRLDEILQVVHGDYKGMSDGKELDNTEKIDEKNLNVESITSTDGVIHIQVEQQFSVSNDLNEK